MAVSLSAIVDKTGLTENVVLYRYTARRNAGDLRHQIFRDSEITLYGVIDPHLCHYNEGQWMLRVYNPAGQLVELPSRHGEDHPGCVSTYYHALNYLHMDAEYRDQEWRRP